VHIQLVRLLGLTCEGGSLAPPSDKVAGTRKPRPGLAGSGIWQGCVGLGGYFTSSSIVTAMTSSEISKFA
jgi:hypothetical protein